MRGFLLVSAFSNPEAMLTESWRKHLETLIETPTDRQPGWDPSWLHMTGESRSLQTFPVLEPAGLSLSSWSHGHLGRKEENNYPHPHVLLSKLLAHTISEHSKWFYLASIAGAFCRSVVCTWETVVRGVKKNAPRKPGCLLWPYS